MKKIYMRAGMSPFDEFDPSHVLLTNAIGNNVGNLIYAYGMFRTLTTADTEVAPSYYRSNPKDAEQINEEYESFVIPLADAFRPDFMPELRNLTKLVKKLKIPCVVTGVGLRAPFEPGNTIRFPFDEDVKSFIRAVLEKSSVVGVRGEITASYLSGLGFREGKDHIAIGCPSMYTFGRELPIRDVALTNQSKISVNSSILSPTPVHGFLDRTMTEFPNHYFLPQRLQELKLLYTGQPYAIDEGQGPYPCRITDRVYQADRVKFFLRATEWIEFLKTVDISVGGRLHGNIAAIIAGTPSLLIPHDARMRELADFHSLPHVWAKDIDEQTNLLDLASRVDFQKVSREHGQNFDRFLSFLNGNGLSHIYEKGESPVIAPLESRMDGAVRETQIKSICNCSFQEMADRWDRYYPEAEKNNEKLKNEVKKLRERVNLSQKARKIRFFGREYEVRRVR